MNEEKIITTLLDHGERLTRIEERMVTKDDLKPIIKALDQQSVILQRLDQERVFTIERVKGIEKDIAELKIQLKLA